MSYVVDHDAVQTLDEELHGLRCLCGCDNSGHPLTPASIDRWWAEAVQAQEDAQQALHDLFRKFGVSVVIEALRAEGLLHDDRWDDA